MSLYKTSAEIGGFVHSDASALADKLVLGDGLGWPGDPRLELRMGIRCAKRTMFDPNVRRTVQKGEVVARRYEVWRVNEDGSETPVGHWLLEEFDRILFDLTRMRSESPGHVDIGEAATATNDALEAAAGKAFAETTAEVKEYATKLIHDRNNPANTFRGIPGRNPEKQA
jgi:hypothetical protein